MKFWRNYLEFRENKIAGFGERTELVKNKWRFEKMKRGKIGPTDQMCHVLQNLTLFGPNEQLSRPINKNHFLQNSQNVAQVLISWFAKSRKFSLNFDFACSQNFAKFEENFAKHATKKFANLRKRKSSQPPYPLPNPSCICKEIWFLQRKECRSHSLGSLPHDPHPFPDFYC